MRFAGFEPVRDDRVPYEDAYVSYVDSGFDEALNMRAPINRQPEHSFAEVEAAVDRVLKALDGVDTNQLLWFVLYPLLIGPDRASETLNLSAAHKSMMFLLALVLQTRAGRRFLPSADILPVYVAIESVADFYRSLPSWREPAASPSVDAVIRSFTNVSHNAPLISVEQELLRLKELFGQYPDEMKQEFGATAEELLSFIDELKRLLARGVSRMLRSPEGLAFDVLPDAYWKLKQLGLRVTGQSKRLISSHYELMISPFCFARRDVNLPRDVTRRVLEGLSSRRGQPLNFRNFSGDTRKVNPAEERPLIEVTPGKYFVPMLNELCHAIHGRALGAIRRNSAKRDTYLENKVAEKLRELFPSAVVHQSMLRVGEDGENDSVILVDRKLLIVESKAGAPPTPLRDPKVAMPVITDAVNSDTSPFYGVAQGQRLLDRLVQGPITLISKVDGHKLTVSADDFDEAFVVCITLYDWAPYTVDRSVLRSDESEVGTPWVTDFDKFDSFSRALLIRGWDGADLLCYLRERYAVDGRIITNDEHDYAALFVLDGDLASLSCVPMTFSFTGRGPSEVFDDIETSVRQGRSIELPRAPRPSLRS
jgi:hypothetical protein